MAGKLVSIIQLEASRSKQASLRRIKRLLGEAGEGPDLVVLPEYSMLDPTGVDPARIYEEAEGLEGRWLKFFSDSARELNSCMVATLFEKSPSRPKVYNTVVLIDEGGDHRAVYRKTHLFDAYGYRESSFTEPGDRLFDPVNFCGLRVGVAVCFELRFPEVFRYMALRGAEVFIVPAAWYKGPMKEETLKFLAQARAHENTAYTIIASLAGGNFVGRSMVVDPWGTVSVDGGHHPGVVRAWVEAGEVKRARAQIPVLTLRRGPLYSW